MEEKPLLTQPTEAMTQQGAEEPEQLPLPSSGLFKLGQHGLLTYDPEHQLLWPARYRHLCFTLAIIVGPSALCLWGAVFGFEEQWERQSLAVVYVVSLFMCLKNLFAVACTDPGILPSLPLTLPPRGIRMLDQNKLDPSQDYYVDYKSKNELTQYFNQIGLTDPVSKFFTVNRFKFLDPTSDSISSGAPLPTINLHEAIEEERLISSKKQINPKKKHNKLSYCKTCQHLRPPRAFHCNQCGVCIEVHDHHCPWVGNCIGHRNHKHFIGFLFWTGLHALVTLAFTYYYVQTQRSQLAKEGHLGKAISLKLLVIYAGIITLSLLTFACYQTFALGVNNIASNEDIRHRWNGHRRNQKAARAFATQSSLWQKTKFVLFGNPSAIYGPSKLRLWADLIKIEAEQRQRQETKQDFTIDEESSQNSQLNEPFHGFPMSRAERICELQYSLSSRAILKNQYGIEFP